jgi:hypothetical protein
MIQEKRREKILRLIRLSENNPEPNEAVQALLTAKSLAKIWGVNLARIISGEEDADESVHDISKDPSSRNIEIVTEEFKVTRTKWIQSLWAASSEMHGCKVLVSSFKIGGTREHSIIIVGTNEAIASTKETFKMLHSFMNKVIAKRSIKGRSSIDSFRKGFVAGLGNWIAKGKGYKAMTDALDEERKEGAESSALVLAQKESDALKELSKAATEYMSDKFPNTKVRKSSMNVRDAKAASLGVQSGYAAGAGSSRME